MRGRQYNSVEYLIISLLSFVYGAITVSHLLLPLFECSCENSPFCHNIQLDTFVEGFIYSYPLNSCAESCLIDFSLMFRRFGPCCFEEY